MKKSVNYKKLPYFETKVVKVKKEKKFVCPDSGRAICLTCGERLYHIEKPKEHTKGNWVNGENLDKIKFPCFCRYKINLNKYNGMITSGTPIDCNYEYILHYINNQRECSVACRSKSLETLIKEYDIHILKGKIIIFENEEGD